MKKQFKKISFILLTISTTACDNSKDSNAIANSDFVQAETSAPESEEEWTSLFDGKSLSGWHGFNKSGEVKNWTVEDGALVCLGAAKDARPC